MMYSTYLQRGFKLIFSRSSSSLILFCLSRCFKTSRKSAASSFAARERQREASGSIVDNTTTTLRQEYL